MKTWEMELSHKTRLADFKSINPVKFSFSVNGRRALSAEETLAVGSYNALLQTSLPPELRLYKADAETFESSHAVFHNAFPRGFAWEVLAVYSGPPRIAFKYRHWGYMEGPYMGHAPTGELVQFTGVAILNVSTSHIKLILYYRWISVCTIKLCIFAGGRAADGGGGGDFLRSRGAARRTCQGGVGG